MSIRKRIILVIISTLLVLVTVLWGTTQTLVLGSFDQLEEKNAIENVKRAKSAVEQVLADLDIKASDWSAWDDTYQFVKDGNQDFIDSNISDSAFAGMKLNIMVIIDNSGKIMLGRHYDMQSGKLTELPKSLVGKLVPSDPILQHPSIDDSNTGIIMLKEGPLMLASRPILNSAGEGPARGNIIFGRFLDKNEVNRLSELTHLAINAYPKDSASSEDKAIVKSLEENHNITHPVDKETITAYTLFSDIYKANSVIIQVDVPREIHRYGLGAVRLLLISVVTAVMLFAVVMIIMIDRLVLVRITKLKALADNTLQQLGLQ